MFSTYRCKTCGIISDEKENLCQPEQLISRAEFCRSARERCRSICDRMDRKIEYQCFTCGQPTEKPDIVCSPTLILEADEETTGLWRKAPFSPRKQVVLQCRGKE